MSLGTTIANRYRIDRTIGHGGMGEIYAGTDLEENQIVAVKRLKRELVELDNSVIERFLREGEVQQQLQHPNIVQVVDVCQHDGDHYLVLEYVGGGTLGELLKRENSLPIPQAIDIAYHIGKALQLAHEIPVVHRDLKPANILMMPNGTPKLTDFGAASVESKQNLTITGMVIGTYAYMSPESCKGERVDVRADVWSFGIMLFEMLTGQRPFSQDNPMQLMLAIMREPPVDIQSLNPEISDGLADLVYRMLAKDKNQRIPTMEIVVKELAVMLDDRMSMTNLSVLNTRFLDTAARMPAGEVRLPSYGPLIGREKELKELVEMMSQPEKRLITVMGPGGIGKTHLAVDAASYVEDDFSDGIYFVDFTSVTDDHLIPATIASALKFQFFGPEDPVQQLINYLQSKKLLLIADNFEELASASKMLLRLIDNAPDLSIVLTSRVRLNLKDEWLITLDGLTGEKVAGEKDRKGRVQMESAAYRLFIQKARQIRSDYAPSADDKKAIYQICELVDGSPLAIELAAGWVNMLSAYEILEEMAGGMDFLETNLRDVPERHRSIRSISENSWKFLNDDERIALARLSVFRGGYKREAIREIVGASLLTLNSLIDKSLLRRSPESGLYSMQEMLRWFAAEKLADLPDEMRSTKAKHSQYYLNRLKELTPNLIGGGQLQALASIERRLPNIQVALKSATEEKDLDLITNWIDGMFSFYLMRGRQREGAEAIRQATFGVAQILPSHNHVLQVKMMSRLGAYYRFIGELDNAHAILGESLKMSRELNLPEETAFALYQLGAVRPNMSNALPMWREAFDIAEKSQNSVLLAETANWLAFNSFEVGEIETAIGWLERGLAERRKLKDAYGLAIILTNLGFIHMQMGNFGKSKRFLREALEINKKLGNYNGIAAVYNNLSYIALHTNELKAAANAATQAVQYYERVGNKRGVGESYGNLIDIALKENDLDKAERICNDCIKLYSNLNLPTHDFQTRLGYIALDRGKYRIAHAQFLTLLGEEPRPSLKLELLTGLARMMAALNTDHEMSMALLKFIADHPATEQVVKSRAESYLDTMLAEHGSGTLLADGNEIPNDLEDWIDFILDFPFKFSAARKKAQSLSS